MHTKRVPTLLTFFTLSIKWLHFVEKKTPLAWRHNCGEGVFMAKRMYVFYHTPSSITPTYSSRTHFTERYDGVREFTLSRSQYCTLLHLNLLYIIFTLIFSMLSLMSFSMRAWFSSTFSKREGRFADLKWKQQKVITHYNHSFPNFDFIDHWWYPHGLNSHIIIGNLHKTIQMNCVIFVHFYICNSNDSEK